MGFRFTGVRPVFARNRRRQAPDSPLRPSRRPDWLSGGNARALIKARLDARAEARKPELYLGAHLVVTRRGLYTHHGVYAGDNRVVHKDFGPVRLDSWQRFSRGWRVRVVPPQQDDFPPEIVLERALSRLGETGYDLVADNCEHFVTWCRTGHSKSWQVAAGLMATALGFLALSATPLHPAGAVALGLATFMLFRSPRHQHAITKRFKRAVAWMRQARQSIGQLLSRSA